MRQQQKHLAENVVDAIKSLSTSITHTNHIHHSSSIICIRCVIIKSKSNANLYSAVRRERITGTLKWTITNVINALAYYECSKHITASTTNTSLLLWHSLFNVGCYCNITEFFYSHNSRFLWFLLDVFYKMFSTRRMTIFCLPLLVYHYHKSAVTRFLSSSNCHLPWEETSPRSSPLPWTLLWFVCVCAEKQALSRVKYYNYVQTAKTQQETIMTVIITESQC